MRLLPLAVAIAVGALGCTAEKNGTSTTARTPGTPAAEDEVPTGLWGGDGIILRVTETVSTVEYECAAGVIEEPLFVEVGGRFEADGRHSALGGGPIETSTEGPKPARVRYVGSTDGTTMTLTVVYTKTGDELGTFHLERGLEPHLERCL